MLAPMRPSPIIPSCISTACHVSVRSVSLSTAEIERDVALGRAAHAALLEHLRSRSFDASAPSRLPGWSRAHVLTHLARNADGHRRMIEGAARGEVLEQYAGGVEGRNAGIDAGAGRPAADVLADFATASDSARGRVGRLRLAGVRSPHAGR